MEMQNPGLEVVLAKALSLDADLHPQAWIDLAQARWEGGRYVAGEETLQKIAELDLISKPQVARD